tara:strand:+ start:3772 stop:4818 length:1047 start_codon:yes stop_codon:yes gene_type:complete
MEDEDYDVDQAWTEFCENGNIGECSEVPLRSKSPTNLPKCSDIYISTKTKIAYLSDQIDLETIFWQLEILGYHVPKEGIVKKQMKFNSINEEKVEEINNKLKDYQNADVQIINRIINPTGRVKFKDIRKISIGLCQKDITSYRSKKRSAFYNCFVLILRIKDNSKFKEIHVKVFNTGKLEIPGIRDDVILQNTLDLLINILNKYRKSPLTYDLSKTETVLINSNFNCGYFINRDKLLDILKYKYHISCIFDACQYPGIQCKYDYQDDKTGTLYQLSFMIFRTGSILIVGKCNEETLYNVYENIKLILETEYKNIFVQNVESQLKDTVKKKKIKKKIITIDINLPGQIS